MLVLFLVSNSGCVIAKYKLTACNLAEDRIGFMCSKGGDTAFFMSIEDAKKLKMVGMPADDFTVMLDKCAAWKEP